MPVVVELVLGLAAGAEAEAENARLNDWNDDDSYSDHRDAPTDHSPVALLINDWFRGHVESSRPEASAKSPASTPRQRRTRPRAASSLGQPRPIHWQICSGWPWPHRPCLPHRSSAVDFPKAFSPAEQLQLTRALPDERTRQQCMLRWIQRLAQPPAADAADAAGAGAAAVVRLAAIARVSSALLGEPLDE